MQCFPKCTKDQRPEGRCSQETAEVQVERGTGAENGREGPSAQTTELMFQELAEALDARCLWMTETQLYDFNQTSVTKHFLRSPAAVGLNIQQHLRDMQDEMCNWLLEKVPPVNDTKLMLLIDFCNQWAFNHLRDLLLRVRFSKNSFLLKEWIERTTKSAGMFDRPDLKETDPRKYVRLLEATERVANKRAKITDYVKKDIRRFMDNILKMEMEQKLHHSDEARIQLYVDTIQLIDQVLSMIKKALRFNPQLSKELETWCFQELLVLLKRYKTEQEKTLKMKAEEDTEGTIHYFKTLKNCREIKKYVQTKDKGTNKSPHQEILATLEETEQLTQELLKGTVTEMAKSFLKDHFRSGPSQFASFLSQVEDRFPQLEFCPVIYKEVMEDVYKLIANIYLKRLFKKTVNSFRTTWSRDGQKKILEDAEILRDKLSQLGADVQHVLLLKISVLLQWFASISLRQKVMDDAYSVIIHTYVKHLLQRSQKKLRKRWSGADVGHSIKTDAEWLHWTISDLAPDVQEQNLILLKISDLLQDQNLDQMKTTAATVQTECPSWSEDQDFLPRLLRWKGLSRWDVTAVLDALPDPQPRPRSATWCFCLPCCC